MKVPPGWGVGFYHCLSRVVDRQFLFGEPQREQFRALMREYESFCEVRVLTYCILSNHFHILLEVPQPPEVKPSAEVILEKLSRLTGQQDVGAARQELETLRRSQDAAAQARWLARYHARMWDVSAYMKLLKQRFTQWYNGQAGRRGTLWEDRFKSVLVEGQGAALVTMAAYIDLNPVRAGLVADPKDYRWSGYGESMAGRKRAREGLQRIATALLGHPPNLLQTLEVYRMHVFSQGSQTHEPLGPQNHPSRAAVPHQTVLKVLAQKGRLPLDEYLRCRVRYFCDGTALGSRAFVDAVFRDFRTHFGARRKNGARRLKGLQVPLFSLRDLQLNVFG
jgi:putative transposase